MTLMDRFGRTHDYLRLSITDRCNLRCVYCMPEEGLPFFPTDSVLSAAEIIQLVKNFADLGIKKVRLTGGEPLLRKDVLEIVQGIRAISAIEDIAVTTNGLALKRLAKPLREAGVDRLNISLDTFDANKYRTITRGGNVKQVLKGIEEATAAGFDQIKINTVVIHGQNDNEIIDFLRYTLEHPVNVRFIEFMPISEEKNQIWQRDYVGVDKVFDVCHEQGWSYKALPHLKGNGPSENFQLENAQGSFGLIHPISCNFCESCNRLRITADGCIKSCLYWDDEANIRDVIYDPEHFAAKIQAALDLKPENHEMALAEQEKVADKKPTWRHMSQIGG